MSYTLPSDVDDRPIAIDGAGVLGRRIRLGVRSGRHGRSDLRCLADAARSRTRYVTEQMQRVRHAQTWLGRAEARCPL